MEWIKTTEKLPKKGEFVLIYNEFESMEIRQYTGNGTKKENYKFEDAYSEYGDAEITHWMKLPNKPIHD